MNITEDEIWKDVPGYEGYYQVSNMGEVKRLPTRIKRSRGGTQKCPGRILKKHLGPLGYYTVGLSKEGKSMTMAVHKIVMLSFKGESNGKVIDHINHDKSDNRLCNLRYCTQRENLMNMSVKSKCGYTGVSLNPPAYKKRYRARIRIGGKMRELGSYRTAFEAHRAYLAFKIKINNQ